MSKKPKDRELSALEKQYNRALGREPMGIEHINRRYESLQNFGRALSKSSSSLWTALQFAGCHLQRQAKADSGCVDNAVLKTPRHSMNSNL